jgi:hypothetical protein
MYPLYAGSPPANTTLTSNTGPVGQSVSISGSNFDPNSSITISYNGSNVASNSTNSQGSFTTSFIVPSSVIGPHSIQSSDSVLSNTQTFTVVGCIPPGSGDWNVTSSCTLPVNSTAPANVLVQPNVVLTIPSGVTLTIHFTTNHILVNAGGRVVIQAAAKISS